MKQEQVIELAKKAGFMFHDAGYAPTLHTLPREYSQKCFERLVSAVEQATLERAAQACEQSEAYRGSVFAARIRAMKDDSNSTEFDGIKTVQMPRFNPAAKRKLDMLLGDGATITGYAFQQADGRHGSIDCHGFVQWRTEQVEVHMPEPVGKVSKQGWASWNGVVREGEPLYTEQQIRTLLAQHGIKIAG